MAAIKPTLKKKDTPKEDAILKAATSLFLRKGYSGVSMEEIAKKSSVAKQTLYSYFRGKDDLFRSIIHAQSEAFFAILPDTENSPQDIKTFLYQVGTAAINMMFRGDTLELYRLLVSESPRFPELGEYYWQTGGQALIKRMTDFLQENGFANKHAKIATDQFLSLLIGSTLSMALLKKNYRPTKLEKERHIELAVSAFFVLNAQYIGEKSYHEKK